MKLSLATPFTSFASGPTFWHLVHGYTSTPPDTYRMSAERSIHRHTLRGSYPTYSVPPMRAS